MHVTILIFFNLPRISFQLLKEMYLLGRGELYLTLIDHLHITMKGPPTTAMTHGKSTVLSLDQQEV